MVDEHAGQLAAHRFGQQRGADAGIHAAGQRAQHLAGADLPAQFLHGGGHKGVHPPGAGAAADLIDKVVQHAGAVFGVHDLRVELHTVQPAADVLRRGHRAVGGVGGNGKAGGGLLDVIVVAHPADVLLRQAVEQRAAGVQADQGLSILPLRGAGDLAAQHVHHQLAAVADAQDGHAPGVNLRVDGGGVRQVDAVGTAGEDDPLGIFGADGLQRRAVRVDLAVDVAFADTAGDQLVILAAEVDDNDSFLLHGLLLSFFDTLLLFIPNGISDYYTIRGAA